MLAQREKAWKRGGVDDAQESASAYMCWAAVVKGVPTEEEAKADEARIVAAELHMQKELMLQAGINWAREAHNPGAMMLWVQAVGWHSLAYHFDLHHLDHMLLCERILHIPGRTFPLVRTPQTKSEKTKEELQKQKENLLKHRRRSREQETKRIAQARNKAEASTVEATVTKRATGETVRCLKPTSPKDPHQTPHRRQHMTTVIAHRPMATVLTGSPTNDPCPGAYSSMYITRHSWPNASPPPSPASITIDENAYEHPHSRVDAFRIGWHVEIKGLQTDSHLNGRLGVVVPGGTRERVAVAVGGLAGAVCVRTTNLVPPPNLRPRDTRVMGQVTNGGMVRSIRCEEGTPPRSASA
jgi:hypothetical protein